MSSWTEVVYRNRWLKLAGIYGLYVIADFSRRALALEEIDKDLSARWANLHPEVSFLGNGVEYWDLDGTIATAMEHELFVGICRGMLSGVRALPEEIGIDEASLLFTKASFLKYFGTPLHRNYLLYHAVGLYCLVAGKSFPLISILKAQ